MFLNTNMAAVPRSSGNALKFTNRFHVAARLFSISRILLVYKRNVHTAVWLAELLV